MIRDSTVDAGELALYQQKAPAARAGHDLTPLAFYGAFEVLEGAPIEGAVILRFPNIEAARAWYDSPAYREALPHRLRGAESRAFIIEGIDTEADG
ncbi:MAG: DUF1330 domain-containing protein [Roseomonas mucosa]|nr:DUF1330 domain-containing protein [Roseomonas mucosa]